MNTICALATSPGGALGVIRVSGDDSITIVNNIFSKDLSEAAPYKVTYGTVNDPATSEKIDEVLVTVFRAPHSYTGENSVEISCHGSQYIQQRIVEVLLANGCLMAQPGEYTQRAFLNGKMDLSQAEAVADLITSTNASQHRVAFQQMRGGISAKLSQLRDQLLEMTSLLELELDFSEEDVEFADREKLLHLANTIEHEITRLTDSFSAGNAIKNGIPVAIIGAPNVGKSTLLNALLKDDRAIVSNIQGTTRDVIEDTMTLHGITFRFIDTAGIRHTDDEIEKIGIERSMKAAERAQIILLMTEPGVPYPEIITRKDQVVINILNKSNAFQALGGLGMDWLEKELLSAVAPISNEGVLVTNMRHKQALDLALTSIRAAIDSMQMNLSGDLISEDLRLCLTHLGEITGGQITSDEVLGNIFKHFCIGK